MRGILVTRNRDLLPAAARNDELECAQPRGSLMGLSGAIERGLWALSRRIRQVIWGSNFPAIKMESIARSRAGQAQFGEEQRRHC